MRIRWRNFELPSSVTVDQDTLTDEYGKFIVEPFEKGFGHTIGNGLRRCLLSSIEGTAVVAVDIEGVDHEFTTMDGVLEDITEVVLNLKGLLVELDQGDSIELVASRSEAGELTAGQIDTSSLGCKVLNPDHVLCTLTDDVPVKMTIRIERGRGYVTAEEHESGERVLGVIAIDSNFSPVKRVRYKVEETRVGKITNYDRLVLELWTDGTVAPEDALGEASKIFRKHLNAFVHHRDLAAGVPAVSEGVEPPRGEEDGERAELREKLARPIDELDFSVRARHCLDSENIQTVGELVSRTEADLLKVRNFGKTSLTEIHKKLENLGLSLGMTDIEDLVK